VAFIPKDPNRSNFLNSYFYTFTALPHKPITSFD